MKQLYPWQFLSWQTLHELRGRLPHALLLKGPQGIGKLDLALNYACSLLCEHPTEDGAACGACRPCRWFDQDSHPDFRLVQPSVLDAENDEDLKPAGKKPSREISVDQIRDLATFSHLSSHCGGYRIILIQPAEAMNGNAANSLLKTLEEPASNLLFLLVTHKPQLLLPTIISRCMSFILPTPARDVGELWLAEQGVRDSSMALAQAGFAPLQALSWAESGDGSDERRILLDAVSKPSFLDPLSLTDRLQRCASVHVVHCLQQWCHDLTSIKLAGSARYFPDLLSAMLKLAEDVTAAKLMGYQKELLAARRAVNHPLNQRLFLESLLLSYKQLFDTQHSHVH